MGVLVISGGYNSKRTHIVRMPSINDNIVYLDILKSFTYPFGIIDLAGGGGMIFSSTFYGDVQDILSDPFLDINYLPPNQSSSFIFFSTTDLTRFYRLNPNRNLVVTGRDSGKQFLIEMQSPTSFSYIEGINGITNRLFVNLNTYNENIFYTSSSGTNFRRYANNQYSKLITHNGEYRYAVNDIIADGDYSFRGYLPTYQPTSNISLYSDVVNKIFNYTIIPSLVSNYTAVGIALIGMVNADLSTFNTGNNVVYWFGQLKLYNSSQNIFAYVPLICKFKFGDINITFNELNNMWIFWDYVSYTSNSSAIPLRPTYSNNSAIYNRYNGCLYICLVTQSNKINVGVFDINTKQFKLFLTDITNYSSEYTEAFHVFPDIDDEIFSNLPNRLVII